jgi:hypothetical protein
VTCPPNARILEPEETAIAKEQLGIHASAVTHAIELLEAMFSMQSVPRLYTGQLEFVWRCTVVRPYIVLSMPYTL